MRDELGITGNKGGGNGGHWEHVWRELGGTGAPLEAIGSHWECM